MALLDGEERSAKLTRWSRRNGEVHAEARRSNNSSFSHSDKRETAATASSGIETGTLASRAIAVSKSSSLIRAVADSRQMSEKLLPSVSMGSRNRPTKLSAEGSMRSDQKRGSHFRNLCSNCE